MTQVPSIGRIVHYALGEHDALAINRRRADSSVHMAEHRENANGVQIHIGNLVQTGDAYPLVITRVWNTDPGTVNGQLLLDGNDTLWVTSVTPGDGVGHYSWPQR
jgi:hypothetical protein